jgi:hypothetical protein
VAIELGALIKEQQEQLEEVAVGVAEGDQQKILAALVSMALGVATGHPEIAILAPLLQEWARRAFASTATARLRRAMAQSEASARLQRDRNALVAQIADGVEALLGQALIQLVRSQHCAKDEIVDALGGLKDEFASFREDFQQSVDNTGIRVDKQQVREGATGILISAAAETAKLWIGEMTVSGRGSVGIDLSGR